MTIVRALSYTITKYEDGCLWGEAFVTLGAQTFEGQWKYPGDLCEDEVLLCLTAWAEALLMGERDHEKLYTVATELQLQLPFCSHRKRRR